MITQKTLDALKSIGLNLYERKLYAALLARGNATAGELSEMAVVPRSRSYDVLESLADKGFVVIQQSKPLRYVAVKPKEALERTKAKLKENLNAAIQRIENFKNSEALEELESLHQKGVSLVEPADLSGSLKGRYAMHQQLETMLKGASRSVDIMTTEEGLNELWAKHSSLLQNAKERGVKVRIIASVTPANKDAAESISKIASFKELKSKTAPRGRLAIADGSDVLMALTDDREVHSTQDVAFWASSDHFASSFAKRTFDIVWKQA